MMLLSFREVLDDMGSLDAEPFREQRGQRRFRVLLQASIFPIDGTDDVTVHNISEQGLMAESDVDLSVGQVVHLSFDGTTHRSGTVRWIQGRRFGLHLEGCLGVSEALDEVEPESAPGQVPRPARLSLNIPARMSSGRPRRPAMVRNMSRSGMLLETSSGLLVGQNLLIKIGRQAPIAARVRWSAGGHIGVSVEGDQMAQLVNE